VRRAVFVDTSAWYALADFDDRHHETAARLLERLVRDRRVLLTTNSVVGETYTLLRARLGHAAAHGFLERVRHSSSIRRVFVAEAWEVLAEELLARYADQDFSYVDATSFVTMQQIEVAEAFAYDHHFAVAGFALLRDG
jgi:predicted nucleic acid-binding protein